MILLVLFLFAAYWGLMLPEMIRSIPETDLFWMFPAMAEWGQTGNLGDRLLFLFSPAPINLGQPVVKIYLSLKTVLHWNIASLLIVAGIVHGLNSLLLRRLGRQLGLPAWAAASAGLLYLCSVSLFHAYLWPTAVQHLFGLLTLLATLSLYLQTEQWAEKKGPRWKQSLAAAWVLGLISSLQRSAWMGLFLILLDLIFSRGNHRQKVDRWNRWLPLFLIASVYPALLMGTVGDIIIGRTAAVLPLSGLVRAAVLVVAACVGLMMVRWFSCREWKFRPDWRKAGLLAALAVWGLLAVTDHRQILLPYNFLQPMAAFLSTLLDPFRSVLRISSTEPYHYFRPPAAAWPFLVSGALFWKFFSRPAGLKSGAVTMLAGWYGISFIHLLRHYSSFPIQIPSRYFVYFVPVICLILCSVAAGWAGRRENRYPVPGKKNRYRVPRGRWSGVAAGSLFLFCLAGLMAVRVEVFRGRLINQYLSYEDHRVLSILRAHAVSSEAASREQPIFLQGIAPMPMAEFWGDFLKPLPSPYTAFSLMADDLFGPGRVKLVGEREKSSYQIRGAHLLDESGQEVERFWKLWQAGLKSGEAQEAQAAWEEAVQERPFLLKYLLGSCRLSDARWMTDGRGLKEWIGQIERKWRLWSVAPVDKWERTQQVMAEELSAYAGCLVGLSVTAAERGREEEAQGWLSQLYFLEPDPERLKTWLQEEDWLKSRPAWRKHLDHLEEPRWFKDPLPWQKDDYGFGRFLLRLVFSADIRSGWDIIGQLT